MREALSQSWTATQNGYSGGWDRPGPRPEHVPASGTSCGASWHWREAPASGRSPTTGRCSSSCCLPASTHSRRAARTPSAPCRPARVTSATSWTTVRSASTAWVRPGGGGPGEVGPGRFGGGAGLRAPGLRPKHTLPASAPAPRTPRLRLPLCRLLHAGFLAAQPPAPALCPHRRTQFLPVHRPLLLLPVGSGSWPAVKGRAEGQDRAPTDWTPRSAGRPVAVCLLLAALEQH